MTDQRINNLDFSIRADGPDLRVMVHTPEDFIEKTILEPIGVTLEQYNKIFKDLTEVFREVDIKAMEFILANKPQQKIEYFDWQFDNNVKFPTARACTGMDMHGMSFPESMIDDNSHMEYIEERETLIKTIFANVNN